MKNIILAVILVLLLSKVIAQYFIVYADTIDFEEPCNYLFIDTSATNLWQMGIPGKTIFDSAYSMPNAIITDTVNYYPTNNHSSLVIKLDPAIFSLISNIDVHFWHKFDTDSLNDYGVVEVSYDTGNVWKTLRTDTTYINFIFFERNGSWTATHLSTGQSNGWFMDTYTFNSYLTTEERPDNIWLRFSFYSDSVQDEREGWMIDDIIILGIEPWGIKENALFNSYPYPNPCQQKLYISTPECGKLNFTIYIYDNMGKPIVTKSFDNESIQVNLNPYPAGLYFYKITDNDTRGISNGKFIIKK
jgi:hypothetical protein